MIRALLAEWIARQGIQWTFICREPQGQWAAWFSNLLFSGSHRGTLLSVHFYLKKEKFNKAISKMRGYYAVGRQRAEWEIVCHIWCF